MGYSISLAVSVSKLTTDKTQTVRVIYFKFLYCFGVSLLSALRSVRVAYNGQVFAKAGKQTSVRPAT